MASVDIVIPVYNEEHVLTDSVATLRKFLAEGFAHQYRIVVADNASTDGTLAVAQKLAQKHSDVASLHVPQKGRGRALRAARLSSPAGIGGRLGRGPLTRPGGIPTPHRGHSQRGL